jgi:hypothetical protein
MKLSPSLPGRRTSKDSASEDESWVDREIAGCKFQDVRLGERFRKLLEQIGSAIGQAIPFACQDWATADLALTQSEIDLLDKLVADKSEKRPTIKAISHYLIKLAKLGGYLARANDGPPGNKVIWRGLSRLTSIELAVASG